MSLQALISDYGPLAVFLGAGIEGETAVFLGGVFAHRQLFPFWQAAAAAALGSFVADQIFFYLARYARRLGFVQRLTRSSGIRRVNGMLEAHPHGFILAFRFIYGIRIASPVAIGLSSVPAPLFLVLNAIAAAIWALVITAIGYLFGDAVESLFGRLRLHVHLLIALAVVVAAVAISGWLVRRHWRKAGKQNA